MSPGAIITLADFFGPALHDLASQVEVTLDTNMELRSLQETLTRMLPKSAVAALSKTIAGRMQELLDVEISDVLGSAWSKSKEIREAIKATKLNSNETVLIPLMEHTIESEHRPYVDIRQGQITLARVTFQVSLEVLLKGAELKIEKGRIQEIITGEAKTVGKLRLGGATLLERKIESLHVAGPVVARFEDEEETPEYQNASKESRDAHEGAKTPA